MNFLTFCFSLSFILLSVGTWSAAIDEETKRFIYEIEVPISAGYKIGTAFAISDTIAGKLLVTCKHVVFDSAAGNIVDSVFLRKNRLSPQGQSTSDTDRVTLYLKRGQFNFSFDHPDSNIDLIMVHIGNDNTSPPVITTPIYALKTSVILSEESFNSKGFDEGTPIHLLGYSIATSAFPRNEIHYPFMREGVIGLYTKNPYTLVISKRRKTAKFIMLDLATRPGDSGSPIFGSAKEGVYLIGFLSASSDSLEYGVGYPVYYLLDHLKVIQNWVKNNIKK